MSFSLVSAHTGTYIYKGIKISSMYVCMVLCCMLIFIGVHTCRIVQLNDAEIVFFKYDELMDLLERFVVFYRPVFLRQGEHE